MANKLPIPNLVILGAQKSGTTSLHEYMKSHPDIFMSSPVKEPGYYLGEERARIFWQRMGLPIKNREQLLRQRMLEGYQGERWFGEASTYYTIGGRSRRFGIPQRMHRANPDMRFIYIMRDPVERIISNYWHCKAKGKAGDSLQEFLSTTEGRIAFRTSRYHHQLEPYLDLFAQEQFCLLLFEDLRAEPEKEMQRIWDFLELPPLEGCRDYPKHNVSKVRNDELARLNRADIAILRRRLGPDIRKMQRFWRLDIGRWEESKADDSKTTSTPLEVKR